MYRARVEAVSGVRVRAGGKWLTCIGNKNVRVGDLIWTDGRCVYGHEQTPQQPHVITSDEDLAIPILLNDGKNDIFFTFRKGQLQELKQAETKNQTRILNNKSSKVYSSSKKTTGKVPYDISAANCGSDIYTLETSNAVSELSHYFDDVEVPGTIYGLTPPFVQIPIEDSLPDLYVDIKKNGKIIQTVSLNDSVIKEVSKLLPKVQAISLLAPLVENYDEGTELTADGILIWTTNYDILFPVCSIYLTNHIFYSFIEDENSWAFIHHLSVEIYKAILVYGTDSQTPDLIAGLVDQYRGTEFSWGASATQNIYWYVDSSGKNEIIYNQYEVTETLPLYGRTWDEHYLTHEYTSDFDAMKELKYPLQDDFYFKISDVKVGTMLTDREKKLNVIDLKDPFVKYDIYSPQDKLLFSCEGLIGTNFVISKISSEKYLVGIRELLRDSRWKIYSAGLYICEDGELKILIGEAGDYQCQNYLLRPMKRYKGWYEKIESID